MRVLSLCSGIGGLDLGLRLAVPAAKTVAYVKRNTYCQAVLRARIADGHLTDAPIFDDVRTFDGTASPAGRVDCVTAGFPCQPWSQAGKRGGTADSRWLWPDIARIIREVGPRIVLLENVPGLLDGGIGHVLGDLAECGFDAEWDLFSAAEAGAPHLRIRLFIVAYAGRDGREERSECDGGATAPIDVQHRHEPDGLVRAEYRAKEAASVIRGMDDAAPSRVDRLRAAGNAVVPDQAALAFSTLWGRLTCQ